MFRGNGKEQNGQMPVPSYSLGLKFKSVSARIKRKLLFMLLGDEANAYRTGVFRSQGEIHQWMYDRYSLRRLLEQAGFKNVQVKIAFESQITDWEKFDLDGSNGILRKPDSLFVEAIK